MNASRIPPVLAFLFVVLALVLIFSRQARADAGLPRGITCEQVVEYSRMLQIPNTRWGRAQARMVALALGFRLTTAQLDAAALCIAEFGQ